MQSLLGARAGHKDETSIAQVSMQRTSIFPEASGGRKLQGRDGARPVYSLLNPGGIIYLGHPLHRLSGRVYQA